MTAQCYPESSSVDIFSGGGWLDFNATYSYGIVHRKLLADYNHTPTMPTFFIESTYESEHNSTEVQIRRQAYWASLCGGFGHVFGNFFIWSFGGEFVNEAGGHRIEGALEANDGEIRNKQEWYTGVISFALASGTTCFRIRNTRLSSAAWESFVGWIILVRR